MIYTQLIRLALRRKSELTDEARRGFIMELCVSKATYVAASVIDMRPLKSDLIV